MTERTGLFTDERVFWHAMGTHALFFELGEWVQPVNGTPGVDTPDTKRRLLNLASASGLAAQLDARGPAEVTRDDLLRVHTADYIDRFKALSDAGGGDLGRLAPFSRGGFEIALVSAGLAKGLISDIASGTLTRGFALCRPCGHHCLPDMPMGFCLLANIPVAIEAARASTGLGRVAIVDWDVHHGNGTQAIYYERADTLTISLHQDRCFPPGYSGFEDRGEGAGHGYNLNIPLPAGSGEAVYLHALDTLVLPALERFAPDLIVVASGLDANTLDPLARMLLHSEAYRALTARMRGAADRLCGGRLAVVQEGGYSEAYVPFCGHAVLEALSGLRTAVEDPALAMFRDMEPGPKVNAFFKSLVDEMAGVIAAEAGRA